MQLYDVVMSAPEVDSYRFEYEQNGINFNRTVSDAILHATEGILSPNTDQTVRLVAKHLAEHLTACIGEKLASKKPTNLFGRFRYALANLIWPQR